MTLTLDSSGQCGTALVAVIIDTSDDDNNDTDDNIVETSDETSDAAEAQDTANVTNKLCFILGAKDS